MKFLNQVGRFVFVFCTWPAVAYVDVPVMGWKAFIKSTVQYIKTGVGHESD